MLIGARGREAFALFELLFPFAVSLFASKEIASGRGRTGGRFLFGFGVGGRPRPCAFTLSARLAFVLL